MVKNFLPDIVNNILPGHLQNPGLQKIADETEKQHTQINQPAAPDLRKRRVLHKQVNHLSHNDRAVQLEHRDDKHQKKRCCHPEYIGLRICQQARKHTPRCRFFQFNLFPVHRSLPTPFLTAFLAAVFRKVSHRYRPLQAVPHAYHTPQPHRAQEP